MPPWAALPNVELTESCIKLTNYLPRDWHIDGMDWATIAALVFAGLFLVIVVLIARRLRVSGISTYETEQAG